MFVPPGVNEELIEKAGLRLVRREDVTENATLVSGRWREARQRHEEALLRTERAPSGSRAFSDSSRPCTI